MRIDCLGKRFSRLLVTAKGKSKGKSLYWICKCDCGKEVEVKACSLRAGLTKSCGCYGRDLTSQRQRHEVPWMSSRTALIQNYKTGATRNGLVFELDDAHCHTLFQGTCYYCGALPSMSYNKYASKDGRRNKVGNKKNRVWVPRFPLEECSYIYNGIDRVDNSKGYTYEEGQCVSCCNTCNRAKWILPACEWKSWIAGITNRPPPTQAAPLHTLNSHELASFNKLIRQYRNNAKNRHVSFDLSAEECYAFFKDNCHYCGKTPNTLINNYTDVRGKPNDTKNYRFDLSLANFYYNGIDRLEPTSAYSRERCVSCCKICNHAKYLSSYADFTSWLRRLVDYQAKLNAQQ